MFNLLELPPAFDAAALPEELEHIALVWLIPGNFHRRNGTDVQSINVRKRGHLINERCVPGDNRGGERVTDVLEHFVLRHLHHAGIGTEEFAVRQRMLKRIPQDWSGYSLR